VNITETSGNGNSSGTSGECYGNISSGDTANDPGDISSTDVAKGV